MKPGQSEGKRNYSIDLLRIISMIMIVVLHMNSHGGVLQNSTGYQSYIVQIVEAFCLVSVNVFVLISGYFLVDQNFRLSRLIFLLFEVFFYSWIIYGGLCLSGLVAFKPTEFIAVLFPVSFREYWFITSYVGMYLLSPILRWMVNRFNKWQHFMTIAVLLVITSFWHDLIPMSFPFQVNDGYSLIWFVVVFLIAAYIKRYGLKIKRPLLVYAFSCGLMFLSWIIMDFIASHVQLIKELSLRGNFTSYCSILNILGSVSLFSYFINREQNNGKRVIAFFSPLTLGVYLIHDNIRLRDFLWSLLPQELYGKPLFLLVFILTPIVVFICCTAIDFGRKTVFSLFDHRKCWSVLDSRFTKVCNRLFIKSNQE